MQLVVRRYLGKWVRNLSLALRSAPFDVELQVNGIIEILDAAVSGLARGFNLKSACL